MDPAEGLLLPGDLRSQSDIGQGSILEQWNGILVIIQAALLSDQARVKDNTFLKADFGKRIGLM